MKASAPQAAKLSKQLLVSTMLCCSMLCCSAPPPPPAAGPAGCQVSGGGDHGSFRRGLTRIHEQAGQAPGDQHPFPNSPPLAAVIRQPQQPHRINAVLFDVPHGNTEGHTHTASDTQNMPPCGSKSSSECLLQQLSGLTLLLLLLQMMCCTTAVCRRYGTVAVLAAQLMQLARL